MSIMNTITITNTNNSDIVENKSENTSTVVEPIVTETESKLVIEVTDPIIEAIESVVEVTEPIIEVTSSEPVIEVTNSEPIIEVTSSEPVIEVTKSEPIIEAERSGPIIDVTSSEPIIEAERSEPIIDVTSSEPIIEAERSEPIIDVTSSEPIIEAERSEPIADVTEPIIKAERSEPMADVTEPIIKAVGSEPIAYVTEPIIDVIGLESVVDVTRSESVVDVTRSEPIADVTDPIIDLTKSGPVVDMTGSEPIVNVTGSESRFDDEKELDEDFSDEVVVVLPCGHCNCRDYFLDSGTCKRCDMNICNIEKMINESNVNVDDFKIANACYLVGVYYEDLGLKSDAKKVKKYYLRAAKYFVKNKCKNDYYENYGNYDHKSMLYMYADIATFFTGLNNDTYDDLIQSLYADFYEMFDHNHENGLEYSLELYNYAKMLIDGVDGKTDMQKALNILKKQHEIYSNDNLTNTVEYRDICYLLGDIYYYGKDGIDEDTLEAYSYYKIADCKYSMGIIHYFTDNVKKAIEILDLVPTDDELFTAAQKWIGDIYRDERRFKNYAKAIHHYEKSVTKSDCTGYLSIGDLYMRGGHGIEKDFMEAGVYYNNFIKKTKRQLNKSIGYKRLVKIYKKIKDFTNVKKYKKMSEMFKTSQKK
jgi:TPR repeat protein